MLYKVSDFTPNLKKGSITFNNQTHLVSHIKKEKKGIQAYLPARQLSSLIKIKDPWNSCSLYYLFPVKFILIKSWRRPLLKYSFFLPKSTLLFFFGCFKNYLQPRERLDTCLCPMWWRVPSCKGPDSIFSQRTVNVWTCLGCQLTFIAQVQHPRMSSSLFSFLNLLD